MLVGQLAQDPARLAVQRQVDLLLAHPARRADDQPLGPHGKADGAPLRVLELVGHHLIAQAELPIGAGVAQQRQGRRQWQCRAAWACHGRQV